jgi:hypothetical protein
MTDQAAYERMLRRRRIQFLGEDGEDSDAQACSIGLQDMPQATLDALMDMQKYVENHMEKNKTPPPE